jgi:hypothetical protein
MAGAAGGAGLGGAGVVAFMLPSVDGRGDLSMAGAHTLPSGRAAELCDILPETQPFTSVDWLVVRMVVPDLAGPGSRAPMPITTGFVEKSALPGGGMDPAPARIVVQLMAEPFIRGEPAPGITQSIEAYTASGRCLHLGAFVMQIQDFAPRSSSGLKSEASESQTRVCLWKTLWIESALGYHRPWLRNRSCTSGRGRADSARSRTGGPKAGATPRTGRS